MNKDEAKSRAREGHLQLVSSIDLFSKYREIDKFNVALDKDIEKKFNLNKRSSHFFVVIFT